MVTQIGLFSLLQELFQEIHITEAIYQEATGQGEDRPGSRELLEARASWIQVHATPPLQKLKRYQRVRRGLSLADASVIALAKELSAELVLIDDLTLRKFAKEQGLAIAGSGEVLIRAKQAGLITTVREPLEAAISKGLRLSQNIKERLLERGPVSLQRTIALLKAKEKTDLNQAGLAMNINLPLGEGVLDCA